MYQTLNVYRIAKPIVLNGRRVTGYIVVCNDDYVTVSRKGSAFEDFAALCDVQNDSFVDIPLVVFSQREELVNLLTLIDSGAQNAGFPVSNKSYSRTYIISATFFVMFQRCHSNDKIKEFTSERFNINMDMTGTSPSQDALILSIKALGSKIDSIVTAIQDRRRKLFKEASDRFEEAVLNITDCVTSDTSLTLSTYHSIASLFAGLDSSDWRMFDRYHSDLSRSSAAWWVIIFLLCIIIIFTFLLLKGGN